MAEKGASVVICGRKQENLDKALAELRAKSPDVLAQTANMGKSDQAASLFQAIERKFGKLDILVNNVGTNLLTPSVAEADEGLWDKLLETNLKSAFLASSMAYNS